MITGVQQGCVLPSVLFVVYIDELLLRLNVSGMGCFIGNKYPGREGPLAIQMKYHMFMPRIVLLRFVSKAPHAVLFRCL